MKTPYKMVRDVGGQSMIGVPDGIGIGNMYEPVVDPQTYTITYYLVKSTKPAIQENTNVKEQ